jgi:16S rRNA (cytosine967-C5)-methyltransferase
VAEVLEKLGQAGVDARPHANGLSVVLCGHADLTRLEVFTAGLVQPQDAAATAVVAAADLRPGMAVLDLCAAPGTKTTHLAERMDDRGRILAVDVSQEKLARIRENCQRLGVTIVQTLLAEQVGSLGPESFDLVLVDAPCSNTGVLARRPEARWRYSLRAVQTLAGDQLRLLRLGARFVKPGGRCVYSTCSMEEEENRRVVQDFLREPGELRLAAQHLVMPCGGDDAVDWNDGGFRAVLERVR